MISEQEFVDEYNKLVKRYGYQCVAILQPRMLGSVLQVETVLSVAKVDGWKEPDCDTIKSVNKE